MESKIEEYIKLICIPVSLQDIARKNMNKWTEEALDRRIADAKTRLKAAKLWLDKKQT